MELGTNIDHYYNLYDQTKGYTEMLFRAGRILQSKELNEMQSMLKNQIKNVGDSILTNGDVIEGCQLVINGTDVIVTKGKIYLDGDIREVKDTNITIEGVGQEIIGARVKSEVVTPKEDENLLDVATGYDNYNQDGAYRLKEYVEIVVNESSATILYTLVDGIQLNNTSANDAEISQFEKIQNTLARRTFDESGNYKVNGLTIVDKKQADDKNIYVSLDPGKAYVRGYEVVLNASRNVVIEKPTTLRYVRNETKTFKAGTMEYTLNYNYIDDIGDELGENGLICTLEYTSELGKSGGTSDTIRFMGEDAATIKDFSVTSIEEITFGSTTYIEGVDYQLGGGDSGGRIEWLTANMPDSGSTFTVKFRYTKTLVKGVDYQLIRTDGYDKIKFISTNPKFIPVPNTLFYVTYRFALCRRDVIALDKDGAVVVTQGQPDVLRLVESPNVDGNQVLVLGSVLVKPESNDIMIFNNNTKTIPMLELYKMLDRLNAIEFNQAISDLDKEAIEGEDATQLLGVYTDGFIGFTKSDINHKEWSACIDLENQVLTVPFKTTTKNLNIIDTDITNYGAFASMVTAPYATTELISQMYATGTMRINAYDSFPKAPTVEITPSIDNWIDETIIQVEDGNRKGNPVTKTWWYHKDDTWASEEKALWDSLGLTAGDSSTSSTTTSSNVSWSGALRKTTTTTTTAITTRTIANEVLDSLILYMREKEIKVEIKNLEPNADNIVGEFDGHSIALTPENSGYKGTEEGALKADVNGIARGSFVIPANTLCGSREFRVYPKTIPSLFGTTTYTSVGRTRVVTSTVTNSTVYQVKTSTQVVNTDPLAQSFEFNQDQLITGIGIYLKDKDTTEPLIIQVRNMVNGYPGTTIFADQVIQPKNCKQSVDGSVETRVTFDNPVYCNANEQYCFTILSNSNVDSAFICETTKQDLVSGIIIAKNPYFDGTMFSSSNAKTWTAHQNMDLKFKVYGAKFEEKGVIEFDEISGVSLDRLMVVASEDIPANCRITWKYAINGSADYMPIETYDDRTLSTVAKRVKVRADISGLSNISPAIRTDSLMLIGFANLSEGVYISRNVYVEDGFNHIKQVIDLNVENVGADVTMYYATDIDGNDWHPMPSWDTDKITFKSYEYNTYTFEQDLGTTYKNYRVKVVLSNGDNQTIVPKAKNLRSIMKIL